MHDGKRYDSNAIVGAANGFLRGERALTAGEFRDTPVIRAISAFGTPSAVSMIIRARFARPHGTLGSRASSPSF